MPEERLTKNQRREAAREAARVEREQQKRRDTRNKILFRGLVTIVILAILGGVGWAIYAGTRPAGPGPENMLSDGILLTGEDGEIVPVLTDAIPADGEPVPTDPDDIDTPLHIVSYVDFFCPVCNAFEQANAATIDELVATGDATLEVHPISILDRLSLGTEYSTRSANAAACVASEQPDLFHDFAAAMFANQPAENTVGLSDDEIIEVAGTVGADSDEVQACIRDGRYEDWVAQATERALTGPLPNADIANVQGTPTVIVNGVAYQGAPGDAAAFASFLAQQYPVSESDGTATPTPTPTP